MDKSYFTISQIEKSHCISWHMSGYISITHSSFDYAIVNIANISIYAVLCKIKETVY